MGPESDRERFFRRIRRALGRSAGTPPTELFPDQPGPESRRRLECIARRTDAERRKLLNRLRETAGALSITVQTAADPTGAAAVIAALVAKASPEWGGDKTVAAWRHPLIDAMELDRVLTVPVILSALDIPDLPDGEATGRRRALIERIERCTVGITAADFCLAETATVVLRTRPGQARSVSLLPSVHVAVIPIDRLIRDLGELYALLRWDPAQWQEGLTTCLTLISGPSKTADIEATLVRGAHGPSELHLILVGNTIPLDE